MNTTPFPPELTLYYSPKACSLAPHIVLEESGLRYSARSVNIRAGEHRGADYLLLNPSGTVPSLAIGEQILTESQALLTYLADLVPERELLPRPGTLARARAHEWMNFISSSLHPAYRAVFRPQSYGGDSPEAVESVRVRGQERLLHALKTVEQRLSGNIYALGNAFSAVDAYLFVFYLWSFDERLGCEMPERSRYRALAHLVWQRNSVRKVVARERGVRPYELPIEFTGADASTTEVA
ncbi:MULTISPECIES: glutathione S-transferase N-terminal domain-containing protein [Polaromonas]|uniref:Glutathione S-transferase N-terminal domain-containing protein n=1 Tax=Polaromonas aquatica TaxID=332657 RepID=A0ABW1TUI6_9BURK